MKIEILAKNQRKFFRTSYTKSCFSEDCTEQEMVLMAAGDFYLRQKTYTRILLIQIIDENNFVKIVYQRGSKK